MSNLVYKCGQKNTAKTELKLMQTPKYRDTSSKKEKIDTNTKLQNESTENERSHRVFTTKHITQRETMTFHSLYR